MTAVSPAYILESWEQLKTSTTPKSTYGLFMNLISASLYICSPGYSLKVLARGPKTINLAAS